MSSDEAAAVTSGVIFDDNITASTSSVFDRYSWVGLLSVHGPTALQVCASNFTQRGRSHVQAVASLFLERISF